MLCCARRKRRCAQRSRWRVILSLSAVAVAALLVWPVRAQQQATPAAELSSALVRQIETLTAAKSARTPAQRKVSSHLLHASRLARVAVTAGGSPLDLSAVEIDVDGTVTVDVQADVTPEVLARIDTLGGSVLSSVPQYDAVRARLPLAAVETLAGLDDVQSIRPADEATTRGRPAAGVQSAAGSAAADPAVSRKVNTSEGDAAHRADQARRRYGVDGTGIGIGVLSDGVDSLVDRQASGDLPATVTVLPGQARPADADDTDVHDEGTAMLEIIHDLAPGADLYFATAFGGQAQFAANIEALCAAGADVIVDDIGYFREGPFQDGIVAQGINAAAAAGCVYVSAAGNNGNLNDGTAGVWEGDFDEAGSFTISGKVVGVSHQYNARGANVNRITDYDFDPICLKWSDPLGASANDYDLYLVDPDDAIIYTNVSSTDTQNGSQDPVECIGRLTLIATGEPVDLTRWRLVVVKAAGAGRFLHLNTHGGRLTFVTDGQMYDHAAAANAIGVASTDVIGAGGAGGVFDGSESANRISSDGPRRIFFHPDGRAITPGDFSSTGGLLLRKPDVTAADGVSTTTPGFETFFGTSAAAAHAAAIAALMLQTAGGPRSLTRAQLLQAMQDTALDIEAPGNWDRDSGAGVIDALTAVGAVTTNRPPVPVGTLPPLTIEVDDAAVVVDVAAAFRDPDSDTLTYAATSSTPAVAAVAVSGSMVTVTPVAAGTATLTVTATDGSNTPATQTFTVTVTCAFTVMPGHRDVLWTAETFDVTVATAGGCAWTAMSEAAFLTVTAGDSGTGPGTVVYAVAPNTGGPRTGALMVAGSTVTVFQASPTVFTDHPIQRGATPVKAIHFLELRARIERLREADLLTAFSWTDPTLRPGVTPVRQVHLVELRTALDEVYAAAQQSLPRYMEGEPNVKAVHLMELRAAVLALE